MKKAIKIILPSAAGAISIAFWIYMLNMIGTVNSEKIFFLNTALGNFYASAYRIFAVISLVLLIVWILAAVKKVPKLIALIRSKLKDKKQTKEQNCKEGEKDESAEPENDSFVDVPEAVPLVEEKNVDENPAPQGIQTGKVVEEVIDPFESAIVSAKVSDAVPDLNSIADSDINSSLDSAVVLDVTHGSDSDIVPGTTLDSGSAAVRETAPDPGSADTVENCEKCGKQIPIQARFCPFCGNKKQ